MWNFQHYIVTKGGLLGHLNPCSSGAFLLTISPFISLCIFLFCGSLDSNTCRTVNMATECGLMLMIALSVSYIYAPDAKLVQSSIVYRIIPASDSVAQAFNTLTL